MTSGAVYIVHGDKARSAVELSISNMMKFNDLPIAVVGEYIEMTQQINFDDMDSKGRYSKVNLFDLSTYQHTLYLDADTVPYGDLSAGFDMLDDGFDIVIMPSSQQGMDLFWHIGEEERQATFFEVGTHPLQLQAGLFFFRKNERTKRLFKLWEREYRRYKDQDQAALIRALYQCQVKVWLLGHPWNGGSLVGHRFGVCR